MVGTKPRGRGSSRSAARASAMVRATITAGLRPSGSPALRRRRAASSGAAGAAAEQLAQRDELLVVEPRRGERQRLQAERAVRLRQPRALAVEQAQVRAHGADVAARHRPGERERRLAALQQVAHGRLRAAPRGGRGRALSPVASSISRLASLSSATSRLQPTTAARWYRVFCSSARRNGRMPRRPASSSPSCRSRSSSAVTAQWTSRSSPASGSPANVCRGCRHRTRTPCSYSGLSRCTEPSPLEWMASGWGAPGAPHGRQRLGEPAGHGVDLVVGHREPPGVGLECGVAHAHVRHEVEEAGVVVGVDADGGDGELASSRPASTVDPRRPGPITQKRCASMVKPTTSPAAVRPVREVPRLPQACAAQAVSRSPAEARRRAVVKRRASRARVSIDGRGRSPARLERWYTTAMPIYEFCCNQCGTAFEELVRNGTRPECPQCHSGDVCRLLSTFAVHSSSSQPRRQGSDQELLHLRQLLLCHLPLTTSSPRSTPSARRSSAARTAPSGRTRTKAVFGEGDPGADLMFVGEAPGYHEDQQGRPFVGQAGKLLEQLLASIGLTREQVYIANVLKSRPPNNRDPRPEEIDACRPYLFRQIEIIRPRVICTLGNFSTKLLTGDPHRHHQGARAAAGDGHRRAPAVPVPDLPSRRGALHAGRCCTTLKEDFLRLPELLAQAAPQPGEEAAAPPAAERPAWTPPERLRRDVAPAARLQPAAPTLAPARRRRSPPRALPGSMIGRPSTTHHRPSKRRRPSRRRRGTSTSFHRLSTTAHKPACLRLPPWSLSRRPIRLHRRRRPPGRTSRRHQPRRRPNRSSSASSRWSSLTLASPAQTRKLARALAAYPDAAAAGDRRGRPGHRQDDAGA